jgi:hypothetical protein
MQARIGLPYLYCDRSGWRRLTSARTGRLFAPHLNEGGAEMPDYSREEQVTEKARGNGYLLIPHAGEYVLVDFADRTWSTYDTLTDVEELLADLE